MADDDPPLPAPLRCRHVLEKQQFPARLQNAYHFTKRLALIMHTAKHQRADHRIRARILNRPRIRRAHPPFHRPT